MMGVFLVVVPAWWALVASLVMVVVFGGVVNQTPGGQKKRH
jgi:hypothetical protein